jgi:hypothetical protein
MDFQKVTPVVELKGRPRSIPSPETVKIILGALKASFKALDLCIDVLGPYNDGPLFQQIRDARLAAHAAICIAEAVD